MGTGGHPRSVLLVIEVSDTSVHKDRAVKAPLYAAAGVQDYWIVNLIDRRIERYRDPLEGRYASVTEVALDGKVSLLAFPDVSIPVAALFAQR